MWIMNKKNCNLQISMIDAPIAREREREREREKRDMRELQTISNCGLLFHYIRIDSNFRTRAHAITCDRTWMRQATKQHLIVVDPIMLLVYIVRLICHKRKPMTTMPKDRAQDQALAYHTHVAQLRKGQDPDCSAYALLILPGLQVLQWLPSPFKPRSISAHWHLCFNWRLTPSRRWHKKVLLWCGFCTGCSNRFHLILCANLMRSAWQNKGRPTNISSHNKACQLLNRVLLRRCSKVFLNFQVNICLLIVMICMDKSWLPWYA